MRKIRIRKTPNTDTFHAVSVLKGASINPFLANVPILYALETPENQRLWNGFRDWIVSEWMKSLEINLFFKLQIYLQWDCHNENR